MTWTRWRRAAAAAALAGVVTASLAGCTASDPLAGGPAHTDSVEIARDDVTLVGTLVVPELDTGERVPLVILMHGYQSGRDETHQVRTAEQLEAQGVASLRVDFTGHGLSDGSYDGFADAAETELADARAIYDYAAGLGIASSIGIVGYSLGGLVASVTAGDLGDDVAALVLLAPAPAYGTGLPVLETAAEYDGPVLILQGDSDELVSVRVAEQYADAFADAELRILPHENHSFTYGTDIEGMTVEFLMPRLEAAAGD